MYIFQSDISELQSLQVVQCVLSYADHGTICCLTLKVIIVLSSFSLSSIIVVLASYRCKYIITSFHMSLSNQYIQVI